MDQERLQRRVQGRKLANQILELVDNRFRNPDCVEAFLHELRTNLLPEKVAEETKHRDRQFAEFANYRLGFGEHKGSKLEDIPRQYLEWLADSSTETLEMVTGYLEATEETPDD